MKFLKRNKPENIGPTKAWLFTIPLLGSLSCSLIVGPHHITIEPGKGVNVVSIEGYVSNIIHKNDTAAFHFGRFRRVFVLGERDSIYDGPSYPNFRIYSRLPKGYSLHQSVIDAGVCLAWEPSFRGFSFGHQSRSISRLPVDDGLAFKIERVNDNDSTPYYSLEYLP